MIDVERLRKAIVTDVKRHLSTQPRRAEGCCRRRVLRREMAFGVGDYCFPQPFHVNHDILPGAKALVHVHWSTDGTNTASVRWELQISRCLRDAATGFPAPTSYYVEDAPTAVAWRHIVSEIDIADALELVEPDELIIVTLRRVTNGGTDNTDDVFGLTVDFHYQSQIHGTLNKASDFYGHSA